jgi:hypothetical protein
MSILTVTFLAWSTSHAAEFHVSVEGRDSAAGTVSRPLRTISAAASRAQPGDTVTVHAGVYRERVNPPRGGTSNTRRITYRAASGEKVVISGAEPVTGWAKVQNDTWKVAIPNNFFGEFNPYKDEIRGDWFNARGRKHHTGAVYLNDGWLIEARSLKEALAPVGAARVEKAGGGYLLNVAWLEVASRRMPATKHAENNGVKSAPCSEGGECIGFIEAGDHVTYANVDFGAGADSIVIRAASESKGGRIEVRLDSPSGTLLGSVAVPNTGGWQSWKSYRAKITRQSGKKRICLVFTAPTPGSQPVATPGPVRSAVRGTQPGLWFGSVDKANTTIHAQFPGVDPNRENVEINVRQTVFYPDKPGCNYITVRGFVLERAATPWAPPTAEQKGLIGTHWSKGWIIEDCVISHSKCVGVTLGKYGDEWDNKSQSADAYNRTITRALGNGWTKERIGSHVVRNNHIFSCEQAGIVGSLGGVFSTISGNEIHDIHVHRLFTGAEQAGIKIHASIDMEISDNHVYRAIRGIWLDWMAQGARVTRNLVHDCDMDIYMEVNHGPYLLDNNILLSGESLRIWSQGGAYVHNLIAGSLSRRAERRRTPYHVAHSTAVVDIHDIPGGDARYYNNILLGKGRLDPLNKAKLPVRAHGNVYLKGAKPCAQEEDPLLKPGHDPELRLAERDGAWYLTMNYDAAWRFEQQRRVITTAILGKAQIPDLPFQTPDGSPLRIDTDYFNRRRDADSPFPGPIEHIGTGVRTIKVWPRD